MDLNLTIESIISNLTLDMNIPFRFNRIFSNVSTLMKVIIFSIRNSMIFKVLLFLSSVLPDVSFNLIVYHLLNKSVIM